MRNQILALLSQGSTYNQIAAQVGCAKSTVAYHAKVNRLAPEPKVYDWLAIQQYYDQEHNVRECLINFGICRSTWYRARTLGKIVTKDRRLSLDVLMAEGRHTMRTHLKGRLLREGVMGYECRACGLTQWHGLPLSLELHHINGKNQDNRRENLELLCPNCHSQTPTYSGRNAVKITRK